MALAVFRFKFYLHTFKQFSLPLHFFNTLVILAKFFLPYTTLELFFYIKKKPYSGLLVLAKDMGPERQETAETLAERGSTPCHQKV